VIATLNVSLSVLREARLLMLSPDSFKLQRRVPLDRLLYLFDVRVIERRCGSIVTYAHVLLKALIVEESDAKTSRDDDVTPPLLAEASLKRMHPAFSRRILATCVMNRLAPSTM
jgi:hypothetical protein